MTVDLVHVLSKAMSSEKLILQMAKLVENEGELTAPSATDEVIPECQQNAFQARMGQRNKREVASLIKKLGYRPQEAADLLNISKWKLYDLAKRDPKFPRPIRLSKRCVIYTAESLDEYLRVKVQEEAAL